MTFKIIYLPVAEQDLNSIAEYLSQFYASTFGKFMNMLEKSIVNLETSPFMGVKYGNYRKLAVSDYLVFYKVDEDAELVKIYRVLHGAQDSEVSKFDRN